MNTVPKKVEDRLVSNLKCFQSDLDNAKKRDANEADTVAIIRDMLADLFGFDKRSEVLSEQPARGTFCDLVVQIDDKPQFIVEVKAIGQELKDRHLKQGVDYAAHFPPGVEWVVLTNGINWKVYKVLRTKWPLDQELVLEVDFLNVNLKTDEHLTALYRLSKEGWQKQALVNYAAERQALSKFLIAQVLLSDAVLDAIRRELRRAWPDVKVKNEQIQKALEDEVLKRELLDSENDRVDEAKKKVKRAADRSLREREPEQPSTTPAIAVALASPILSYIPSPQITPPPPMP